MTDRTLIILAAAAATLGTVLLKSNTVSKVTLQQQRIVVEKTTATVGRVSPKPPLDDDLKATADSTTPRREYPLMFIPPSLQTPTQKVKPQDPPKKAIQTPVKELIP